MIILSATTDKIQAVLAGAVTANQLQCYASYRDITDTTYVPGRRTTTTNSTTAVDIVEVPAPSTQRVIDFLSIYNADTAAATPSVLYNANATTTILFKGQLAAGEKLEYTNEGGWRVLTNLGSVKTSVNQGSAPITTGYASVVLAGDVTNATTAYADVTNLSFPVTNGNRYWFEFRINYAASATSTGGTGWAINGPANSQLTVSSQYSLTATTVTTNNAVAYDIPAAANASSTATTGNYGWLSGFITAAANGSVILRFRSETAGTTITALTGSHVVYMQV
jgi:hypothetical protein